ncbi:MAG: hypothetical protein ACI8X3_002189 [Saprospiraceae bacterium]
MHPIDFIRYFDFAQHKLFGPFDSLSFAQGKLLGVRAALDTKKLLA